MNITMSPQQPMLSVTKAIPFQSGIFADVWRVTQERYYQVKKVCRTALINPALICLEQFGYRYSTQGFYNLSDSAYSRMSGYTVKPPTTNVGYSRSGDSSQIYYGMSGGIIAHADGITFGQPLGDTMVLVKAPGADNVKIENRNSYRLAWLCHITICDRI